jgi:hypothetical protein
METSLRYSLLCLKLLKLDRLLFRRHLCCRQTANATTAGLRKLAYVGSTIYFERGYPSDVDRCFSATSVLDSVGYEHRSVLPGIKARTHDAVATASGLRPLPVYAPTGFVY